MAATATATSVTCRLTSPALVDAKVTPRQSAPHSIGLPSLPPPPHVASPSRPQARETWTTAAYCRKVAGKFIARAAGEPSAEVATELPEIVKKIQDEVSAIDRLPVVPGVLEIVGIGYTGVMVCIPQPGFQARQVSAETTVRKSASFSKMVYLVSTL
ncbi:hypothetical protein GW17_00022695 [Ensete ventricosum]|nr:hypothetical protein GW17_00022695 [Ensete ventricosum]RZS15916.1 hypothetical protein BHM03_00047830 [Ensete ventricosum]